MSATLMPAMKKFTKERLRKTREEFDAILAHSRDQFDQEIVEPLFEEIERLRKVNDMLITESHAIIQGRAPPEKPLVAEFYTDVDMTPMGSGQMLIGNTGCESKSRKVLTH